MKFLYYTQQRFDQKLSIELEKQLNQYKGIKAYVNGGCGLVTLHYKKRKANEDIIRKLLEDYGIEQRQLTAEFLLEPANITCKICDIAIREGQDLNGFISNAASLLKKTKLAARVPLLWLAQDNNIKLNKARRLEYVNGKYIKGIIDKKNVVCGTGSLFNENSEAARLYIETEGITTGYIEFCYA